jgi:hypothetical protein
MVSMDTRPRKLLHCGWSDGDLGYHPINPEDEEDEG